ncbi:putative Fructokinase [Azospirillum baldaniorum]|uniref:Fructokinase n=1 Tax=Azospirillum baldaniorum TaxID=1064539 RepID=A0A9P1NME0_9PROT|nr:putative Fructokinase [Azospirillum baldaniorum]
MKRTASPSSLIRVGIDLGGTKTEGIALGAAGEERARVRVPTPRGDYGATVRTIADLVARLESATGSAGATVGIGIPGAVSPATGLVKNANSTWLIGKPFDQDMAEALKRPVRIENDANCLAVSEAADGAGAGCGVVFAAILGTGCGAGIVVDGRPLRGRNAIGGEWGHNPLPWPTDEERPGAALLLRQIRLPGNLRVRPRGRRRPPTDHRGAPDRGGHRGAGGARRRRGRRHARPAGGPARARAGGDRQCPGPGRDRAGRRPVEPGVPLRRLTPGDRPLGLHGQPGHADPPRRPWRFERGPRGRLAVAARGGRGQRSKLYSGLSITSRGVPGTLSPPPPRRAAVAAPRPSRTGGVSELVRE